ncbi:hypothetical protein [Oceanisphaera ostreae]|uniref:Uncharacterized protein n=1 Tax=Oceanisphaera ostreae TaxID=914151 RepID=A0ABW3KF52_9GAMM
MAEAIPLNFATESVEEHGKIVIKSEKPPFFLVIASAARQSTLQTYTVPNLDCRVAALLAMTTKESGTPASNAVRLTLKMTCFGFT